MQGALARRDGVRNRIWYQHAHLCHTLPQRISLALEEQETAGGVANRGSKEMGEAWARWAGWASWPLHPLRQPHRQTAGQAAGPITNMLLRAAVPT